MTRALTIGIPAQIPLIATGGTPPYTYAVLSGLPAGLTLNTSTGVISGTPTAVQSAAPLAWQVTDALAATASDSFDVTVQAVPVAVPHYRFLIEYSRRLRQRAAMVVGVPSVVSLSAVLRQRVEGAVVVPTAVDVAITGQPMVMGAALVSPATVDVAITGQPMTMAAVGQEQSISVSITSQPMAMAAVLEVAASYEPETTALLAALTGTYNTARQEAVNTKILALKNAGVWAKYDQICVVGLNSVDSRINWKSPGTFNASLVGSPAFTADRGFTGSAGNYINSNFNPVTAAGNYSQNSAHLAVYSRTDVNSDGFEIGAQLNGTTQRSGIRLSRASTPTGRGEWVVNSNSLSQTGGITGNLGLYLAARTAASGTDATKFYGGSGAILGTSNTTSNTLLSQPFYVLTTNNNGTPANQSNRQIAAWSIGAGLTDTEVADYRAALETYLDFIGAGVV